MTAERAAGAPARRNIPRLVATDLDETILPRGGTVSARTVAALARVEQSGGLVVLATGRAPRVMADIARAFGGTGTAICANGALSYDMRTGEVETLHLIEPGALAVAAAALRAAVPGVGIGLERETGPVCDDLYHAETAETDAVIRRLPDGEMFSCPAAKLRARHPRYTPDELLAAARPVLDGIVAVSHNGASFIEAGPAGVSKAGAVAELAARHGIGPESVLAFGDMPNDLPLLAWAGTSCAVANAHPDVLAAATHVIGNCADDGVAAYLEELYGVSDTHGT